MIHLAILHIFFPVGSRAYEMILEQERVIHTGSFRCNNGTELSLRECDFNDNTQSDCSDFLLALLCSSKCIVHHK